MTSGKRIPQSTRAECLRLSLAGAPQRRIAHHLGISRSTVEAILKNKTIPGEEKPLHPDADKVPEISQLRLAVKKAAGLLGLDTVEDEGYVDMMGRVLIAIGGGKQPEANGYSERMDAMAAEDIAENVEKIMVGEGESQPSEPQTTPTSGGKRKKKTTNRLEKTGNPVAKQAGPSVDLP